MSYASSTVWLMCACRHPVKQAHGGCLLLLTLPAKHGVVLQTSYELTLAAVPCTPCAAGGFHG